MKKISVKRIAALVIIVALGTLTMAFSCGGSPDPNRGFDIVAFVNSNGVDTLQTAHVIGDFLSPNGTTTGTVEHFEQDVARTTITGARVPGRWRFQVTFNTCSLIPSTFVGEQDVNRGQQVTFRCFSSINGTFTPSPSTVNAFAPPAMGTIYGQGISSAYGMPKVEYYDDMGTLVASKKADAVASDGTWLQGSIPDLTSAYSGTYTLLIKNFRADGSKYIIGTATVKVVANSPPPPDPPAGGCY
jgi:hypothetical protein